MRDAKNWRRLLTLILLIALTVFSNSCKSIQITGAEIQSVLSAIAPPVPVMPEAEQVVFEDREDGLWLSYNDYRALERNLIALREHIAKLEIVIRFYREKIE